MLPQADYLDKFRRIQRATETVTNHVAQLVRPGITERSIADSLAANLRGAGLFELWYPIMVCAGMHTGKPISRRFHLPSDDVKVADDDIIVLDTTPMTGTVWGNWSVTVAVGEDDFFHQLCADGEQLVIDALAFAESGNGKTIGDLVNYCEWRTKQLGLELLDWRSNYGHTIFQVRAGTSVEEAPETERLFLSKDFSDTPLQGIVSIKPQVGRKHPSTGVMYGCKQQRVVIR